MHTRFKYSIILKCNGEKHPNKKTFPSETESMTTNLKQHQQNLNLCLEHYKMAKKYANFH
jgi:hypothetical protein